MATTYIEASFADPPLYSRVGGQFSFIAPTRSIVLNDVMKIVQIERDQAIVSAFISVGQFETAGPTATAKLRLNNGSTTKILITLAAADLNVAAGKVLPINTAGAVGYVVPARGYWLELIFDAAATTPASAIYGVSLTTTNSTGTRSPLAPAG